MTSVEHLIGSFALTINICPQTELDEMRRNHFLSSNLFVTFLTLSYIAERKQPRNVIIP